MSSNLVIYGSLALAIILEVVGTSALQASEQFTRLYPTVLMVASYITGLYFLSIALSAIPVGIAYATWGGAGIILISLIGFVVFGQKLDLPAILGITLIIAGVILVHAFSKSSVH
ncbi:SMR family transporter [Methyloligella sp. 2.7D]|uniref:DMT family transporter n=1 Tax=unclassified Methyloligella TaxID=2625955 RepID=UPI00157E0880|nr:SMR family transporter [Methyloligella sp. GL2]QKP76171.1 QacE family quaternary ammonium compound efflux SMR transporter [Methyloligella sp. GL2]